MSEILSEQEVSALLTVPDPAAPAGRVAEAGCQSFSFEGPVPLPLKRQDTVIMSYSCEENNRDRLHLDNSKNVTIP